MSSNPPTIENLSQLIEPYLNGSKLITYKTRYLTKPGDNYGSIMLAITATIKNVTNNNNNNYENLELVAKLPPTNEIYWKLFQPDRTCPTENSIYQIIGPELEKLQIDANIPESLKLDVFSKFYGARLTLDLEMNSKKVDRNAVLILENLTAKGYSLGLRDEGFDYKHILIVLKNLAKFHALPIAYRNFYPEMFKEKFLKTLKRFNINVNFEEGEYEKLINDSVASLSKIPNLINPSLANTIKELTELYTEYMANPEECPDGPFNTISHYDFWVNNMMFLYDKYKNPIKIKILDYQICQYESLVHDVLFLLFSSVQTSILESKYDELLEYYYKEFIASLELVQCSTEEYSLDMFLKEIKRIAPIQFTHILFMLKVLFMKRDSLPDNFDDLNMDLMSQDNAFDDKYFNKLKDFINLYKKFGYL